MRVTMRVSLSFLAAIPAIVSSAILPARSDDPPAAAASASPPSAVLELELNKDQPKALFRVPCNGCLGPDAEASDDEAFLFDFQAFPSEEPCGVSNVTVNGITLAQVWDGPESSGRGSFRSIPSGSVLPQHELGLSWESACLYGNESESDLTAYHEKSSQVITVTIQTVNGKSVDAKSGFTISFKPVIPLELLRLSVAPDAKASKPGHSEAWRNPPEHLRLTPVDADVLVDEDLDESNGPVNPTLKQHIHDLKLLEAKEAEIKELIRQKKQLIKQQIQQDIGDFKAELKNCDSVSCVFRTILAGAKGVIKVVYYKLKPTHSHQSFGQDEGPFVPITQSTQEFSEADRGSSPSESPPHGPKAQTSRLHPPSWATAPVMITIGVFLSATGIAAIFAFFHRCICNARCRQDRAAAREERRTTAAYRRAARRHRWRRWVYGRDQARIEDYEEKRALIRDQEDILETAMQDEIRLLREAHSVVNSIVHAEEGRGFRPTPVTGMSGIPFMQPHPNRSVPAYVHAHMADGIGPHMQPPRPLSRTNSLPEYQSDAASLSEPPAYEEDEDSSDVVPDGFREYTPSGSHSDSADHNTGGTGEPWTPRSSVIATSPRPSMETLESRRFEEVYERATRSRSSSCSSSQFGGSEKSV